MGFVKLYGALDLEVLWREMPSRTLELLGTEACLSHSMKEVRPSYLSSLIGRIRRMKEAVEYLLGAFVDDDSRRRGNHSSRYDRHAVVLPKSFWPGLLLLFDNDCKLLEVTSDLL
jgi:hypothetical protein